MPANDEQNATKVQITNELDAKVGEWVATCKRPQLQVYGVNAGQSYDRMNSLLKKHFDGRPFVIVEKIALTKELQERVDEVLRQKRELDALHDAYDSARVPLGKDLQKYGLLLRQAAALLDISPTYLGSMARRADSDPERKRSSR
jgi:hypothetical protein